jgi:multiple sugar transport system permease protein
MTAQSKAATAAPRPVAAPLARSMRGIIATGTLTLFATLLALVYLLPMVYAANTAIRTRYNDADAPWWPGAPKTFVYEGEVLDVYRVPIDGAIRELAALQKGRARTTFIDPANPAEPIVWEGRWRQLDRVWGFEPQWGNFSEAWDTIKFGRLFVNTLLIALIGTAGTLISSTLVAYGFSRFDVPGKPILFMLLIGTIILPPQVTLIPTYTLFTRIGWTGTWLPLLVPHFFANAYNVFLLRQFFLTIPRELDEAAMIDGASPPRVLWSVILPQAVPAVIAVALFHFLFAWNDFFGPLIYLVGKPERFPISVGMQVFNALYSSQPHLIQATAVMAMFLPVLIFFFAQRFFIQGVVITGVDK